MTNDGQLEPHEIRGWPFGYYIAERQIDTWHPDVIEEIERRNLTAVVYRSIDVARNVKYDDRDSLAIYNEEGDIVAFMEGNADGSCDSFPRELDEALKSGPPLTPQFYENEEVVV